MKLRFKPGISNIVATLLFIALLVSILAYFTPIALAQGKLVSVSKEILKLETLKSKENLSCKITFINLSTVEITVFNSGGIDTVIDSIYIKQNNSARIFKINKRINVGERKKLLINIKLNDLKNTKMFIVTNYGNKYLVSDLNTSLFTQENTSLRSSNSSSEKALDLWEGNYASTDYWYMHELNTTLVFVNKSNKQYYVTWKKPADTSLWKNLILEANSVSVYEHLYSLIALLQKHWFIYVIKIPNSEYANEIYVNMTLAYYLKARTVLDVVTQEVYLVIADSESLAYLGVTTDISSQKYDVPLSKSPISPLVFKRIHRLVLSKEVSLKKSGVINIAEKLEIPVNSNKPKYIVILVLHSFESNITLNGIRNAIYSIAFQINEIKVG